MISFATFWLSQRFDRKLCSFLSLPNHDWKFSAFSFVGSSSLGNKNSHLQCQVTLYLNKNDLDEREQRAHTMIK